MSTYKRILVCLAMAALLPSASAASGGSRMIRFPDIDPTGTMIAFAYQGDIWTAAVDGSGARRITVHKAYESHPRWSPDGKQIAFSSNRYGNDDVFAAPFESGMPKRLTWHSAGDEVTDWSGRYGIIFTARRDYRQVEWDTEIHRIDINGGTPSKLIGALGSAAAVSPDGRYIAFVNGACGLERERYTGPADREIWLYDTDTGKYTLASGSAAQDHMPKWAGPRRLFYLSALPGNYNVFSVEIDDAGRPGVPGRVTAFEGDGIRYFDVSEAGGLIVAEMGTGIFTMGIDGRNVKELSMDIGSDYHEDPVEHMTYDGNMDQYSISPNGKYAAVSIHGEIFVTENHKTRARAVNVSESPWRDIDPVWTSDTTLAFLSDREGQFDVFAAISEDPKESDLFKSLKLKIARVTSSGEDESGLTVSPDGKRISFRRGNGKLIVAAVSASGELSGEKTLLEGWSSPGGMSWSPDGRYLAWSLEDLNFNSEIFIQAVDSSMDPVNVSMHPRGDYNPAWSEDGGKLAFTSNRNNQNSDVWFVWLAKADWEKTSEDWEEEEDAETFMTDGKAGKKSGEKKNSVEDGGKEEAKPVRIDFGKIHERLVQVTRFPGDERDIEISKDGKVFFFTADSPSGRGRDLFSVKWDGKEMKELTKGGQNPASVRFDHSKEWLYSLKSGKLSRMKSGGENQENVAISARLTIDFASERQQIFDEAWRALDSNFYDPLFHGRDWEKLRKKYRPWAMAASTKRDFRDVFNLMAGQLDASHMGLYYGDRDPDLRETTGLLGVEIEPSGEGVKVIRVIPGSPADKIGSRLEPGETITAVNGNPAGRDVNFYSLLTNTAGTRILLSVMDGRGNAREVPIRPVATLQRELYEEWVLGRRDFTEKVSGGRLGYLHIQGMSWDSFERFERELTAAGDGKDGIVIDVRFNGGGWTTDYLMAILNIKQHSFTIPRGAADDLGKENAKFREYYPYAERLPFYPWMKPSIAICNEMSYSNAEIFSHAYKSLGIGTLVGMPTFGAVISTDGRRLIDGSMIRLPSRAWYVKSTGMGMEHGPAVPDVIVENDPACKEEGRDPQLEKAIEVLLGQIDATK